jgi:hypothetical protein
LRIWWVVILDVPQAEHGPLLDLAQDGEEGRLHTVAVQGVFASLINTFFQVLINKLKLHFSASCNR